jgi:hypothetical protein
MHPDIKALGPYGWGFFIGFLRFERETKDCDRKFPD